MQSYQRKNIPLSVLLILLTAYAMTTACSDSGDETDIPLSEVPANIINIVQNSLPGIELSEAEKEIHGEKTIYELEGKLINGLNYEIEIAADGTILKIELED